MRASSVLQIGWLLALLLMLGAAPGANATSVVFAALLIPFVLGAVLRPALPGYPALILLWCTGLAALAPLFQSTNNAGDASVWESAANFALLGLLIAELGVKIWQKRPVFSAFSLQMMLFCMVLMLPVGLLSGYGWQQTLLQSGIAGLLALVGCTLEEQSMRQRLIPLAVALAVFTALGTWRYQQLQTGAIELDALMRASRYEDAVPLYQTLKVANTRFNAKSPLVQLERTWAADAEKRGDLAEAAKRWQQAALAENIAPDDYAPLLRVDCKFGQSTAIWRKLVHGGFPAVRNPELAEGVAHLGQMNGDLRARLFSALFAWETKAPESERIAKLEAVQALAPGEASTLSLLERMGRKSQLKEWGLPRELLVGERASQDPLGAIDELGAVSTVVVLNPGRYEFSLLTSATPLDEEWPLVRLELNGNVVGSARIQSVKMKETPFAFEVTAPEIFRLTVRMVNFTRTSVHGRMERRGLNLHGILIRRPHGP